MPSHLEAIADLIRRVRARWLALVLMQVARRGALAAAAVLVAALIVSQWSARAPIALALTGAFAVALVAAAAVWSLRPLGDRPSDVRVARFIEERAPSLDDRLA